MNGNPDPNTHHRLLAAARQRKPVVLTMISPTPGTTIGAFPLWATEGGRHVVAVTWPTSGDSPAYRLVSLDACTWTITEVGEPVPALDFEAPVDMARTGPRAVIEALALVERFELEAELGYRKQGEAPRPRRVRRVVCRDNRVVCEDTGAADARSFLYASTAWVVLPPSVPRPTWNGTEYVRGAP